MTPERKPQRTLFFKQHVLPALFVFVVPVFSVWFFPYAERSTDKSTLESITKSIQRDFSIPAEEKEDEVRYIQARPPSKVLASSDPRLAKLQQFYKPVATDFATFRWMKRIAWACLAAIAVTFVIVGLSVAYSLRSHAAQYHALRVGWPVLQLSAATQVLGQAALLTALSYWVTALFMHMYSVKLVGIMGFLALAAVFGLWKAIFSRVDDRCEVTGEAVPEADAPRLWEHVRAMAGRAGTAPPDQIIVGIEPSFFVTEHPVTLGAQTLRGRTLFLSMPMLKVLSADEADAILGHELAHFSGEDTLWSRKVSPLLSKFALYIDKLSAGASAAVAQFMLVFWKLYGLSIRRLSRQREFRADQVGAELVSRDAAKRALVKTTCYCEYRAGTEAEVLQARRLDPSLNLSGRLENGYPAFLTSFTQNDQAIHERVPHPFDSHPTLHNRLEQLGFDAQEALRDAAIQQPVADSWYGAIATAPELEGRLWTERQTQLQAIHDQDLAWRYLPEGEEETAHVRKHFPALTFTDKKGNVASLDYDRLHLPDWEAPVLFKDVSKVEVTDTYGRKDMVITHQPAGAAKAQKAKSRPDKFKGEGGTLLDAFGRYYNRHKTAEEINKELQKQGAQPTEQPAGGAA